MRIVFTACAALFAVATLAPLARACPFCTALKPTLAEQRETAAVAALAEATGESAGKKSFRVHQALSGKGRLAGKTDLSIDTSWQGKPGALVLLFAEGDRDAALDKLTWSATTVTETTFAYAARAPSLRIAAGERLAYFVKFLEHADAVIADDVYQEFGHAAFDDVAKLADRLPYDKLRGWLVDERIPQERKGFMGVVLGIAPKEADRRENLALLEKLLASKTSDFRAGFDGVIGGYLLLTGEEGLAKVGKRFFADPQAAEGDVRHALSAVRFFYEHDKTIDRERFREALRPLLDRKEFAMTAALDLARWKDWASLAKVVSLYDAAGYPQPATRDSVVAYLSACTEPPAADALAALRKRDPDGVAAAELKLGGIRTSKQ